MCTAASGLYFLSFYCPSCFIFLFHPNPLPLSKTTYKQHGDVYMHYFCIMFMNTPWWVTPNNESTPGLLPYRRHRLPKNLDETATSSLSPLTHLHSQPNSSQSHLHSSLLAPYATTDIQAQHCTEQQLCAEWRQDAMAPKVSGRQPSSHVCLQHAGSGPGKVMTFIQEDNGWVEMAVIDVQAFFFSDIDKKWTQDNHKVLPPHSNIYMKIDHYLARHTK